MEDTLAAFCSAQRVTLAASITPFSARSTYSPVEASRPTLPPFSRTSARTMDGSNPALRAMFRRGASSALAMIFAPAEVEV